MRNILIIILMLVLVNIECLAQDANLNSFQGVWTWVDNSEEFTIEL